ncbi:MAG: sugar kinase [Deltaproteobacteria bacterium]|nr:sugar kinase [Deltaproteobacteria bacterium]
MSLLVVGSVALDSVETPFGKHERILGGSATHFSVAASYFTSVNLVAVVGNDFPNSHLELFKKRQIGLEGLEKQTGPTFHWKGKYEYDLNQAITLQTQLGVFESFDPKIPSSLKQPEYLFLANIDPRLQYKVLQQMSTRPKLVALDTMNFWIQNSLEDLKKIMAKIDLLIINEGEARQITGESNLMKAWRKIATLGPKTLIVKRGEYGAIMFQDGHVFSAPALPLEEIKDPTGAGDSFAGGVMGYLARLQATDWNTLKQAIIFGSAMASFNVEDFSCQRIVSLSLEEINQRAQGFYHLASFESDLLDK